MDTSYSNIEAQDIAFDLGDLVIFLWQKKWRIIFLAIVMLSISGYYVVNLPRFYTASSTLLLGGKEGRLSLPSSISGFAGSEDSEMNTYMEFMRSKQFIEEVVLELKLQNSREFQPQTPYGTELEQLQHSTRIFLQNLSLTPVADTDLLKVSFTSPSPFQAARVVNYIGPAFFLFYAQKGKQQADDASQWLNDQLEVLETRLAQADTSLQEFMRENRLMDISSQVELARAEISALLAEKLLNEKALASIERMYLATKNYGNDYERLMQHAYFLQNPLVINLRSKIVAQQQVIAELSKRYKSKHHRHIAATTILNGLIEEMSALLNNLLSNLEREYFSLVSRREALVEQIEMIKAEHSELGKHELQLERLRREVASTQKLYEVFLTRLQETEIMKDLGNTENFVVVDAASEPRIPSAPKVKVLLAVLGIFCGFISVCFWLALHLIADKKTRLTKLLKNNQVLLLGELPRLVNTKKRKKASETHLPTKVQAQYYDAVRNLRSELTLRADEAPIRTLLLASVQQGKRRSNLAVELAKSFSGLEKSILVDADLRNPQIGEHFDLPPLSPGLTNFVSRRNSFSDTSYREKGTQLSVMPSGAVPIDPLVYFSKYRFASFVKKLGVLFERVIIETPPVNAFSDALVISKSVDAVILLCDLESTESDELLDAIQRLQDSGAPLLGVVFENAKNVKSKIPRRSRSKSLIKKVIRY